MIVVDDEWGMRALLKEIFDDAGFSVVEAKSLEELVCINDAFVPDIALVDMNFGRGNPYNGVDIIEALRDTYPMVSPILITADIESDSINDAFSKGAIYCLEKPFNLDHLLDLVDDLYSKEKKIINTQEV